MKINELLLKENQEKLEQLVNEGYKVVPNIDKERYTDMSDQGLEGPFRLNSGKVVYYDPSVGKYYDRDTDMYLSHDEYEQYNIDEGIMDTVAKGAAKVYDMFAAKKPQGYQMRPSADRTGQEAVSDKQEMDKKAFDLWKQTQSEIERSGQGNIISNNKEWYKATLDKWLTKFFKMHEPFHSSATLNSTDDQSVLKYISDARSQYSTMLTQKNPPVNVGLDAYKLHPVTPKINQAIQFGGVVYIFKGKQWVVKKTNRVAEKNIGAKLTKLAVKDLQSEKEPTAADYAPSGSQDTSTSEVPAFKRRKKIVKNVTR